MPVDVVGLNAAQLLRALSLHVAAEGAERWPVLVRCLEEREPQPVAALLLVLGPSPHFELVTGWFGASKEAA